MEVGAREHIALALGISLESVVGDAAGIVVTASTDIADTAEVSTDTVAEV